MMENLDPGYSMMTRSGNKKGTHSCRSALGLAGTGKKDLVYCSVLGYIVLTSSNKSETAVNCCHFLGT